MAKKKSTKPKKKIVEQVEYIKEEINKAMDKASEKAIEKLINGSPDQEEPFAHGGVVPFKGIRNTLKNAKLVQETFFEAGGFIPSEEQKLAIGKAATNASALIKSLSYDHIEADLSHLNPAKVEEVENTFIEVLLETFKKFEQDSNKLSINLIFKNNAHVWKELRWFMSLLYSWDHNQHINTSDQYETDVYYETIGQSMEFIAECKKDKLVLTVTKF